MPNTYKILHPADHADSFRAKDGFALDVLVGLSSTPKSIPSKYFYDERGSVLFREICQLPEYYLTGREFEILEKDSAQIAAYVEGQPFNLVELGAGFSRKTLQLLGHFDQLGLSFKYVPIDISESAMAALVHSAGQSVPRIEVNGLVADYFGGLKWLNRRHQRRNLVLFLGSSIGNFTHKEACFFLRNLWNSLRQDDLVMIGFDMKKDIDLLIRAYNDSKGITREFNLNLLQRINRELGGNFDLNKFRHYGTYSVLSGAMESYLVSTERQVVFIEAIGRPFFFEPWEAVQTEYSYKYHTSDIEGLAESTGFGVECHLFDSKFYFSDSIWRVQKQGIQYSESSKGKGVVITTHHQ